MWSVVHNLTRTPSYISLSLTSLSSIERQQERPFAGLRMGSRSFNDGVFPPSPYQDMQIQQQVAGWRWNMGQREVYARRQGLKCAVSFGRTPACDKNWANPDEITSPSENIDSLHFQPTCTPFPSLFLCLFALARRLLLIDWSTLVFREFCLHASVES